MEIFSTVRKQFIVGLLIYAGCILPNNPLLFRLASQSTLERGESAGRPAWSYVWNQRLKVGSGDSASASDNAPILYTDTDITFSSELKGIPSDSVNLSINSLPSGVRLVSSKKESALIKNDDGSFTSGTRITIILRFSEAAAYRIQPLDVVIDKDFYQIPFENVTIRKNPRTAQSGIQWAFNSVSGERVQTTRRGRTEIIQGDAVVFTVSVKNVSEIIDVFWDIPENCVFRKVRDFDFPSGEKNVPEVYYPVASFEWTPLTTGDTLLPKITVKVKTYNNDIDNLELDTRRDGLTFRVVLPAEAGRTVNDPAFGLATGAVAAESDTPQKESAQDSAVPLSAQTEGGVTEGRASDRAKAVTPDRTDAARIAELRAKERRARPFSDKVYNERVSTEASLGLYSPSREPSIVILLSLYVLFALFLVTLLIVLFLRRKLSFILSGGVVLFLVSALLYTSRFSPREAVYSGGKISFIPEDAAPQIVTFPTGSVVSVKETAGEWAYIELSGEGEGWTTSDNLFFIR